MDTDDVLAVLLGRVEKAVKDDEDARAAMDTGAVRTAALALLAVATVQLVNRLDALTDRIDALKGI